MQVRELFHSVQETNFIIAILLEFQKIISLCFVKHIFTFNMQRAMYFAYSINQNILVVLF